MGSFADEAIILHTEKDGFVEEFAAISTSDQYDYCRYLKLGDESFLFCWVSGTFALVSLDNKRVDFSENDVSWTFCWAFFFKFNARFYQYEGKVNNLLPHTLVKSTQSELVADAIHEKWPWHTWIESLMQLLWNLDRTTYPGLPSSIWTELLFLGFLTPKLRISLSLAMAECFLCLVPLLICGDECMKLAIIVLGTTTSSRILKLTDFVKHIDLIGVFHPHLALFSYFLLSFWLLFLNSLNSQTLLIVKYSHMSGNPSKHILKHIFVYRGWLLSKVS